MSALTPTWRSKAAGAVMLGLAAFPAAAQNVTPAVMPAETVDTILCETDRTYYAHNNWTPITADLDCADEAATDYAESTPGIGVLIHVGQDLEQKGVPPEALGQKLVEIFGSKLGVKSEYFLRQSTSRATGVTFHIGEDVHGAHNGTEVKNLKEALAAMPHAAGLLKEVWGDELLLSNRLDDAPQPSGG